MAALTDRGIPLSSLCPNYLHSNSTSHTWPFSAIAELIDNAYDPDVSAKQFWIDKTVVKGHDCLAFMDNGVGMDYDKMYKMLSFGFSEKQTVNGHEPVGIYGNGFKSGSMRLGKDVIVFSKKADTMCVGLLSLTYLEQIKAKHVMVPIAMFSCTGQTSCVVPHHEESLRDILSYSLFQSEDEILSEINAIKGSMNSTGTRIIIWNLRKSSSGQSEFDFSTDRYDIRIPADVFEGTKKQFKKPEHEMQSGPESDYSLRAYCSILYLKPKMQIIIRGQKVKTELISKSLAHIVKDKYRPKIPNLKKPAPITFGFNTKSKEQYGIMMYHKNRLIKAYERVACQLKADSKGVGVIGVIECNFLKPTHNKQDFDYTEEYRKTMQSLNVKLEEYWKEVHHRFQKKSNIPIENLPKFPDQNWVQCDDCLKWRKLPDGIDTAQLPEKWFCCMNPDTQFRSCSVAEEAEDSEDEPAYQKTYKQHEKNMKKQAEKTASPRPKAKATPNSTRNLNPVRHGVSRSSDNMLVISNVVSLSTTPTRKRSMGLDIKTGMGKSARLLSNFSRSKPGSPSTSAASSEACASPSMFIPGDDSDEDAREQPNDNDIVIIESNNTPRPNQSTFDLSDVKSEKYSDDADMDASVDMQTTLLLPGKNVCSTTQTEPMQAMKQEVEDSEGKKSKEGEKGTCQSEMEQDLLPLERSTSQEQEMNNEGTSKTTNLNISTVKLELQEDEPNNGEVFAKTRPGTSCEGETRGNLQDPTLDLPDGEYMMTLVQQQQQQDNLMELLEAATQERDTCQTQVHILTSRVEELEKSLQEQTEKGVKEKSKSSAAEQEYKVLNLQAQSEKKQLQHELDELRELMRELDEKNKHQEELENRVKQLEEENCSLLTCCESLQKDIQEMKTSSEMLKLNVEDRDFPRHNQDESGVAATGPSLPGSVSQDERLGEPERETGNTTTQTCKRRLRELRQGIARLLVNYVPTLDLQQVNYDCDVIDEILNQVLDHVSCPLGAEQSS